MEPQKTQNCQSNPEEKEQSWSYNPSGLQKILQGYSNQNSLVLAKKINIQINETEQSPKINPHTYSQLMFNRGGKDIQQRKDTLFTKWCWESCTVTCKSMKLEHSLAAYTKINSNWLKYLRNNTINSQKRMQMNHSLT